MIGAFVEQYYFWAGTLVLLFETGALSAGVITGNYRKKIYIYIRLIATFTFTGLFFFFFFLCPCHIVFFPLVSHNVSDVARRHTLRFTVRDVIYLFIYIPEEAKMAKRWVK